jgi:hypothetical protein
MNPCVLMLPLHFGLKDAVLACPLSQRFERPSKPFCEPHETSHQAGCILGLCSWCAICGTSGTVWELSFRRRALRE